MSFSVQHTCASTIQCHAIFILVMCITFSFYFFSTISYDVDHLLISWPLFLGKINSSPCPSYALPLTLFASSQIFIYYSIQTAHYSSSCKLSFIVSFNYYLATGLKIFKIDMCFCGVDPHVKVDGWRVPCFCVVVMAFQ